MPATPHIHLRPWRAEDAPRMVALLNTPAVYRTLSAQLPIPYRVEHQ